MYLLPDKSWQDDPDMDTCPFNGRIGFQGCHILRVEEPEPEQRTTSSGLAYTILTPGDGPRPQQGDVVTVHYTGKLADGTVFDSSHDADEPVNVTLGEDEVIPGLEEALKLLREGAKATVVVPPGLAYGEEGYGPVPGNETISFDIELIHVRQPLSPERDYPEAEPVEADPEEALHKETTASGVQVAVLEAGDGRVLQEDMLVTMHYTGLLDDDTQRVFDSSYDREEPISFILGRNMVIPGWDEALPGLRTGDLARLWIPHEMAYGREGRGPIPPETDLVFDIELLNAEELSEPEPFPVAGKDTLKTESGLQYILVEEGDGELPPAGSVITVHYSGYLSDGRLFDSSVQRSEPLRFVLGSDQVIRGWDEAFALLSKNARARLIIPPHLGYGERGSGPIPPGETLVFDVEVIDIGK